MDNWIVRGDGEWVVRGGMSLSATLFTSYVPVSSMPGHFGFSVQYQPGKTVDELAQAGQFPHKKISFATEVALRQAASARGYQICLIPTPGSGFHHDLEVIDFQTGASVAQLPPDVASALSLTFEWKPNPYQVNASSGGKE